jgi:hypothetical protein
MYCPELCDVWGRKVKTLVQEKKAPGSYELELQQQLRSGIYYYQL